MCLWRWSLLFKGKTGRPDPPSSSSRAALRRGEDAASKDGSIFSASSCPRVEKAVSRLAPSRLCSQQAQVQLQRGSLKQPTLLALGKGAGEEERRVEEEGSRHCLFASLSAFWVRVKQHWQCCCLVPLH